MNLWTRMKEFYEIRWNRYLTRRVPVVVRLDWKSFHTYTRGLDRPFDERLMSDMKETTKFLCENIQWAVLGYTQSDEISILILDWSDNFDCWSFFEYRQNKIESITASFATAKFNELRPGKMAFFDSRSFNIPKEDTNNYFVWRQQDASRNSV